MGKRHPRGTGAQFSSMAAFRRFALSGNAVFTVVSRVTGVRFTYRIRKPEDSKAYFIQLLNGPENTSNYVYFGVMFGPGLDTDFATYRHGGAKAKVSADAPSVKGWEWLVQNIMNEKVLERAEIWHQGKCGKCRKALTVPESIAIGLGPKCAKVHH